MGKNCKKKSGVSIEGGPVDISKFLPDHDLTLRNKGDVSFIIGLNQGVDPNDIRDTLGMLTSDIGYSSYMTVTSALVCVTDRKTYQDIFKTTLQHGPVARGKTTDQGYSENEERHATIPQELEGKVSYVGLNIRR